MLDYAAPPAADVAPQSDSSTAGWHEQVRAFTSAVLVLTKVIGDEVPEEYRALCALVQRDAQRLRTSLPVDRPR